MTIKGSGGGGGKGGSGHSVGPNTLQSDTLAKWVCLVGEGPIQGFGPNPNNQPLGGVYLNDVLVLTNPLELNDEDLTWNYKIKSFEYRYGDSVQTPMPNFSDVEAVQVIGTQLYNTTPVVASTSGPGVDSLRVTVGVGSLIYTDPTSGDVSGTSVHIQIWIQPFGGAWLLAANDTISGQVSGPYMCDYEFPLPDNTVQYNVKLMRITPDSTKPTLENTTYFASFTEIQNVKQYYPNSVLAGFYVDSKYFGSSMPQCGFLVNGLLVQIPSNYYPGLIVTNMSAANPGTVTIPNHGIPSGTSNFQMTFYGQTGWSTYLNGVTFDLCSVIDANTISLGLNASNAPPYPAGMTGNAVAYVGPWDGTFKTAWTNNPAWCIYDLYTNTRYGLSVPAAQVDKWALYTIAQYCDGAVLDGYGGYELRYTMNCVIQQQDNAIKQLALVASCFQGSIYNSPSGVGFIMDRYQAPSEYGPTVCPANVIGGQFSYSGSAFSDRHTVCLVHWNNPDFLYRKDIEVVENKQGILAYGWNQVEITAFGCTSRGQAHRKGAMLLDTEQNSTEIVTYRGGFEHIMTVPGMIVPVADPSYAGARFAGRILSFVDTGSNYTVTLDAPVTLEAGVSYLFGCIVPNAAGDGYITESSGITSAAGSLATISVAYNSWTVTPTKGGIWTISDASGNGIAPRPFVVVDKKEVGDITFEITAVLYDPTKYARVEQSLSLQPPNYTSLYSPVTVLPTPSNLAVIPASTLDSGGILKQKTVLSWECIGITGSSTTSNTIATGSQTFTINTGLALTAGQRIRAMNSAAPTTDWMEGAISSYVPETGVLTMLSDTTVGSGTFTAWSLAQQSSQVSYCHVWAKSATTGNTIDLNTTADDFMNIAQLKPDQYLFIVQAFTSSGQGSQNGYLDYTLTQTVTSIVALGVNVVASTGAVLTDSEVITSLGSAGTIANQGALATLNQVGAQQIADGAVTAAAIATGAINTSLGYTPASTALVSTSANGLAPELPGNAALYLNGNGLWTAPLGFGTATPNMDGTAVLGSTGLVSDAGHVHPTDTSRASTALVSTSANGLVPQLPGSATVYLDGTGSYSAPPKGMSAGEQALTVASGAVAIDWSQGSTAIVTCESDSSAWTITMSNPVAGQSYRIYIVQNSTGNAPTPTMSPSPTPIGTAFALTATASKRNLVTLQYSTDLGGYFLEWDGNSGGF